MTEAALPAPLSVLIVDDCPDTTATLALLVGAWGHRPCVANLPQEALRLAAETCPDVVLLDVGLPRMTGWEVARQLRRLPGMDCALLVVMSGYGGPENEHCSREAGCDLHLTKPADPELLRRLLAARENERRDHVSAGIDSTVDLSRHGG